MIKGFMGKGENGFTLIELLISVCVMAIISVYMLQFFISAKDLSRRGSDLDASVYLANGVMESIKAEAWGLNDFLPAGTVLREIGANPTTLSFESAYTEDFKPVQATSGEPYFNVLVELKPLNQSADQRYLTEVMIQVTRLKPYFRSDSKIPIIYSLRSALLIPDVRERLLP